MCGQCGACGRVHRWYEGVGRRVWLRLKAGLLYPGRSIRRAWRAHKTMVAVAGALKLLADDEPMARRLRARAAAGDKGARRALRWHRRRAWYHKRYG